MATEYVMSFKYMYIIYIPTNLRKIDLKIKINNIVYEFVKNIKNFTLYKKEIDSIISSYVNLFWNLKINGEKELYEVPIDPDIIEKFTDNENDDILRDITKKIFNLFLLHKIYVDWEDSTLLININAINFNEIKQNIKENLI